MEDVLIRHENYKKVYYAKILGYITGNEGWGICLYGY